MTRHRKGTSLVELLVALPVGALIAALAVSTLLHSHQLTRRLNASTHIARELRQAVAVLSSEIRPLAASDIVSWSDTSLEMNALVGSGIACGSSASTTVDLLPLNGTDVLRTSWFATPQPGDLVFAQGADSALVPTDAQWMRATLTNTASAATSRCTTSPHMLQSAATGNPVRLTLSGALSATPAMGSLVRISRRARYSLYRASDGLWYLGRKSSNGASSTTIQPVAGPFNKPAQYGLVIQVRDSANNVMLPGALQTPRSVVLSMSAASAWKRSATVPGVQDSVLMHVTLRGQMEAIVR